MTESSRTSLFAYAGLLISAVTFALVAFSPKQKDCPAPTLSVEQVPNASYVFTDPVVAARRAQSALDTAQLHKKSCKTDPKGYDCIHSAPMPRTNAEWGIPRGGQTISG